jgi:replicative DNA helicase
MRSEELLICSILNEPAVIHELMSSVKAEMFEHQINKTIFECITSIYLEQGAINLITVYQELKKTKSPFGKQALAILPELHSKFSSQSSSEVKSALNYLISEDVRHEHVFISKKISDMSASESYDPKEVINIMQSHIADNKFKSIVNKKDFTNKELLEELDKRMEEALNHDGVNGIKTGYTRYDKLTSGMQPTNFIIIAARPAMGKTQFALGLIRNASIRDNKKGLFISCEMDEVQVMKRLICVDSGIPGYSLKRGNLTRDETLKYEQARKRIEKASFKIVAGSFTISDVLSLVYKLKYSEGLDYVVIDYIQKITSPGAQNRTNEVGDISRKLKDMANELKIPVVALAQLSRAVEHRVDKKPMLSDLRESGDIEQDADIVMFLYRAGYYMDVNERENNPTAQDGYAVIAKHRDGDLEDIQLTFDDTIPAWKNPGGRDEYREEYKQETLKPNVDFDWSGSQPF